MKSQHSINKRKRQRKDYEKKRNVLRNIGKKAEYMTLTAGGGVLPKSRKYKPTNITAPVQQEA